VSCIKGLSIEIALVIVEWVLFCYPLRFRIDPIQIRIYFTGTVSMWVQRI
jgi:hypothetical protein